MNKCDVIIPVYKSPEWVSLCVYSIFKNTKDEYLNKVYLVNDCKDELTTNCLKNIEKKYGKKIVLIQNEKNLGFVGTTNKGMQESKADYVLLLNTDCILSNGAIEKMINNIKEDESIGMVCPISSNAANLTLEMFPGFSFNAMNDLLERKFKGKLFDACTVVGNCLLITKKCIKDTGYLDTAYGLGYGEETDYQFKAMSKGYKAKVCIDTYVYHKSEASFGTSKEKSERLEKNRNLFFSRWGEEYKREMDKYEKNDPIRYIKDNLTEEDKVAKIDTAIYLNGIVQNAGGVHVVVDMVNFLAINGFNANIIYDSMEEYKEIMLFNPISSNKLDDITIKNVVATIWYSVFKAKKIADKKKAKLLYFVQGYECLFDNGGAYGIVETSFKLTDSIFTISNYLHNEIKENLGFDSKIITNGINQDLIHFEKRNKSIKNIMMVLRNNPMKGDWLLTDLIRKIDLKYKDLKINVVYMNEYIELPQLYNNELVKHQGPLSRNEIVNLLHESDLYIDASLNEGFGLTPLEAMASGNAVIVSNSFGVKEYLEDGINGIIINEVNDTKKYMDKIDELIKNPKEFQRLRDNALNSSNRFDNQSTINKYIEYFNNPPLIKEKVELTEYDNYIVKEMTKSNSPRPKKRRKMYYIAKLIPKPIKRKLKRIITYLYNYYSK